MLGQKSYFIFFIIVCIQCNMDNNRRLYPLFEYFQTSFNETFIKAVRETPEKNVLDVYFSIFLYEYGEATSKNKNLAILLKSLKFEDEPSQAYGALLLWHRWLNNNPLKIDEVLKLTIDSISGVKSCRNIKKTNAVYNYKKINTGEDIQFSFPVRLESGIKSTVYFLCPILNWDFNASKDLQINGRLIKKYTKGSPREFFFHLQVTKMSKKDVLYFFNHIQLNDTIEINLNSYGINI